MSKFKIFVHKCLGTDPEDKEGMQPKEVISYSIAGLGQNIICQLVTTFFMMYLTDTVGLNPIWLAVMFLVARLFDAFNDPIMGSIVDRTKTKHGKMRPFLLWMPIPIAICTVLLFTSFTGPQYAQMAYATVIYLVWGVVYTIVDVPYWGLASSMTSDTNKRNSMLTVARLLCTVGSGLVSVVVPIVTGIYQDKFDSAVMTEFGLGNMKELTAELRATDAYASLAANFASTNKIVYLVIAIVCVLIATPLFFVGFKNTKERYYDNTSEKVGLKDNIKLLMKNKPVLILILVGFIGCLRTIYMTTALYYAKYNLNSESLASVIFLLVVPGGLIATLLTPYLSKKFGKKNVFIWSHLVGGALMVLLYFIGLSSAGTSPIAQVFFYIIIIIAGVPSGFSNILTYSMIGDSIDYLEDKTGKRAEGICFSMQTLISKIGMAFTAFVTLLVLGLSDYANADKLDPANISEDVKNKIWLATTLLCGLSMALCAVPLFFYKFTEEEQRKAVARVAARKAAAAEAEGQAEYAEVTATEDIAGEINF